MFHKRIGFAFGLLALTGALAGTSPAYAGRLITTPFAETMGGGTFRTQESALKATRSNDHVSLQHRIDAGLADGTELGIVIIEPEGKPSTTQVNIQQRLAKETDSSPTVSVGVWDAGHIEKLSGEKSGGSLFVAASKLLKQTGGKPPVKLSLGVGTNRLEGVFGGVIVPLSKKLGVMAEYAPENTRLPESEAVSLSLYYTPTPKSRIRISSVGGNPMVDMFVTGIAW